MIFILKTQTFDISFECLWLVMAYSCGCFVARRMNLCWFQTFCWNFSLHSDGFNSQSNASTNCRNSSSLGNSPTTSPVDTEVKLDFPQTGTTPLLVAPFPVLSQAVPSFETEKSSAGFQTGLYLAGCCAKPWTGIARTPSTSKDRFILTNQSLIRVRGDAVEWRLDSCHTTDGSGFESYK